MKITPKISTTPVDELFGPKVIATWADFFTNPHPPAKEILGGDLLDRTKLDYSLESLRYVDEFLGQVRQGPIWRNGDGTLWLIFHCGAYAGEVVRRIDAPDAWQWIPWGWREYERSGGQISVNLGQHCVLCSSSGMFAVKPFQHLLQTLFENDCGMWDFANVSIRARRAPHAQIVAFFNEMTARFPGRSISMAMMDEYFPSASHGRP